MRITHCCLSELYADNFAYQENILPQMHHKQGHQVKIIASTETYISSKKLGYLPPSSYITKEGIDIQRIPYVKWLPHSVAKKLRIYEKLYIALRDFNPDIIFLHGGQTMAVATIVRYIKANQNVTLYVDNHSDFLNSAQNLISKNILHRIIYRWCFQHLAPYTKKFYGTLPMRIDIMVNFYGVPKELTEYLPMGIDTTNINFANRDNIRKFIRTKLGICEDDFVIFTGGQINKKKNIHLLMRAIGKLNINAHLKLLVLGIPNTEMKSEVEYLFNSHSNIINLGWSPSPEIYKYIFAADLACYPGSHSVLWEEAVGLGIPTVFQEWDRVNHLDFGGNCIYINQVTEEKLITTIQEIVSNKNLYNKMKRKAEEKEIMDRFSYFKIAKQAIEL